MVRSGARVMVESKESYETDATRLTTPLLQTMVFWGFLGVNANGVKE